MTNTKTPAMHPRAIGSTAWLIRFQGGPTNWHAPRHCYRNSESITTDFAAHDQIMVAAGAR